MDKFFLEYVLRHVSMCIASIDGFSNFPAEALNLVGSPLLSSPFGPFLRDLQGRDGIRMGKKSIPFGNPILTPIVDFGVRFPGISKCRSLLSEFHPERDNPVIDER